MPDWLPNHPHIKHGWAHICQVIYYDRHIKMCYTFNWWCLNLWTKEPYHLAKKSLTPGQESYLLAKSVLPPVQNNLTTWPEESFLQSYHLGKRVLLPCQKSPTFWQKKDLSYLLANSLTTWSKISYLLAETGWSPSLQAVAGHVSDAKAHYLCDGVHT